MVRGTYIRTPEILAKQSAAQKGRKLSPERIAIIRATSPKHEQAYWFGKTLPQEVKDKISEANSGEKQGLYKDGLYQHYLEGTHQTIRSRCYHPNVKDYARYKAKGVTLWKPWHERRTFIFGILSLLGDRPIGYTLDRINPCGDYTPWNVRWATPKQQSNNRRRNTPSYECQCGEH
jgi:hypothetical protein